MNKIQALEQTIYNLENDVYRYKWTERDNCNCGVVARTILGGKSASDCGFHDTPLKGNEETGTFSYYAFCMTTDLPLPDVFQALKNAGFSHKELVDLENLINPEICNAGEVLMDVIYDEYFSVNSYRSDKDEVIKYLKGWVKLLKKEENINLGATPIKERIKYVSVPESLSTQAKETILTSEITS
jgi:hypothetical protein